MRSVANDLQSKVARCVVGLAQTFDHRVRSIFEAEDALRIGEQVEKFNRLDQLRRSALIHAK